MQFLYSREFKYFSGLTALVITAVVLHAVGWFQPIESAAMEIPRPFVAAYEDVGHAFTTFFGVFGSVHRLRQTNASLESQVVSLEEQNSSLQQDKLENAILQQELSYRSTTSLHLLSATVIGKDPSGLSQTVILNVGSNAGAKVGDAVVAQGAYVGKIVSTDDLTSRMMLITDPQSSVDAEISSTGDTGVLRGSYGSGVSISMVSQKSSITNGDSVVTAGLTAGEPQGLLIGSIGALQSQPNELLQQASVVPAVDFTHLQFVAVVLQ